MTSYDRDGVLPEIPPEHLSPGTVVVTNQPDMRIEVAEWLRNNPSHLGPRFFDWMTRVPLEPNPRWAEILDREGFPDWCVARINSGGGLTLHSRHTIWLDQAYWPGGPKGEGLALFLHEVAHVVRGDVGSGADPHDGLFASAYTQLVERWIEGAEVKQELRHLLFGKGFHE